MGLSFFKNRGVGLLIQNYFKFVVVAQCLDKSTNYGTWFKIRLHANPLLNPARVLITLFRC